MAKKVMNYDLLEKPGTLTPTRMSEKQLSTMEKFFREASYRPKNKGLGKRCGNCKEHYMMDFNAGANIVKGSDYRHKCQKIGVEDAHLSASDIDPDNVCNWWKRDI